MLLYVAEHMLGSTIDALNTDLVIDFILISVFYGFLLFILGVVGEFLEFSASSLQNTYSYAALLAFTAASLTLAHLLGDMSIITGIATSGSPIAGMVLFETRKVLHTFLGATVVYTVIATLTFSGTLDYAPLIKNTVFYESHAIWRTLVLAVVIPNIIVLLSVSLASVIRWKQREKEATYLSQKDALTHANNRGYFMSLLTQSIADARISQSPLCVLMLDIDYFKKINDAHGHLTGDNVILHVSNIIQATLPHTAHYGRYGGEEFCIVIPHTTGEQSHEIAETLRQQIKNTPYTLEDTTIPLTVSIGIAILSDTLTPDHPVDITDTLLFKSDRAMYDVKQGGRDGVKIYSNA